MGRITIKADTGSAARFSLVFRDGQPIGYCRAPGWLQVFGPCHIRAASLTGITFDTVLVQNREQMAKKARYRWVQRHAPRAMRSHGDLSLRWCARDDDTIH